MIPQYPKFKKLALEDKEEIENFTKIYPPYSDYNFVSLWVYNIKDDIIVSKLNNNLIVRFRDYLTEELFYSFLGHHKISETADILLNHSKKTGLKPLLKLIPEVAIQPDKKIFQNFHVVEDQDNFDYIVSSHDLTQLKGNKYKSKRKLLKKFQREYPNHEVRVLNLKDLNHQKHIFDTFFLWEKDKRKKRKQTEHELKAIMKLLKHYHHFNLVPIGLYHGGQMVGFSISEIVHQGYAINHFMKFKYSYKGASEALDKALSEHLITKECYFLNIEQDMGIPGLKESKKLCRPVHFLKKYKIYHFSTL